MGVVAAVMALSQLPRGIRGSVAGVRTNAGAAPDLPSRLRELGFIEGEVVEVMATGLRAGPIAVRVGGSTFALRAVEAECVLVHRIRI